MIRVMRRPDLTNKKTNSTLKEQSQRPVTFETLITVFTIGKNKLDIHDPSTKSDIGQH